MPRHDGVLVSVVSLDAGPCGSLQRVRTVLTDPFTGAVSTEEHTRTRLPATARRAQLADVLIERGTGAGAAAATASSHPGALVVVVHQDARGWIRFGGRGTVRELGIGAAGDGEDPWPAIASAAHAWLVAGLPGVAFGSVPLHVLPVQVSGRPPSSRCSRCRRSSASGECDRPTAE